MRLSCFCSICGHRYGGRSISTSHKKYWFHVRLHAPPSVTCLQGQYFNQAYPYSSSEKPIYCMLLLIIYCNIVHNHVHTKFIQSSHRHTYTDRPPSNKTTKQNTLSTTRTPWVDSKLNTLSIYNSHVASISHKIIFAPRNCALYIHHSSWLLCEWDWPANEKRNWWQG